MKNKFNLIEQYLVYLYKRKLTIIVVNFIACVVGALFAFVISKQEFSASVTFLPPTGDNVSGLSMMGGAAAAMAMGGLGMSSQQQDIVEVLFASNALKRQVIDEFDLITFFELEDSKNPFKQAVERLEDYLELEAVSSGSMLSARTSSYKITAFHTSPDTAKLMVDFTFAIIDSAIIDISINRARRNREFIESQFAASIERIDSLQHVFSVFQIEHKAFNIPEQTKLTLQVYAEIKAASIMNDIRLQMLQQEFRTGSPEITAARNMKRAYERQLAEFETSENHAVLPALSMASELAPQFANLFRELEVQNQIHLLLTRELEQARLQEARDVSPLTVVDPSFVPLYKARPARLLTIIVVVFVFNFLLFGLLTTLFAWKMLSSSEKYVLFMDAVKRGE